QTSRETQSFLLASKSPGTHPRQSSPARAPPAAARFPTLSQGMAGNSESRWAEACSQAARTEPPQRYTRSSVSIRHRAAPKSADLQSPLHTELHTKNLHSGLP